MEIVDCPWELVNLDCRVAEISLSNEDKVVDVDAALINVENNYDYIVVKMPTSSIPFHQLMNNRHYMFVENQITFQKRIEQLNIDSKLVQQYLKRTAVKRVECEEELHMLIDNLTPNMFSTDRIYLDPAFGPKYSLCRYRNWIISEYKRGTIVMLHYFRDSLVGFSMCRLVGDVLHGLLSGVFEKYQNAGIGMFLPLIPYYYRDYDVTTYTGKFSSNNFPVIRMHEQLWYNYIDMEYVFVKHVNH